MKFAGQTECETRVTRWSAPFPQKEHAKIFLSLKAIELNADAIYEQV
jgi:hypothetical protein